MNTTTDVDYVVHNEEIANIDNAEVVDGHVLIGDRSFRIKDMESIELIHHLNNDKNLMEVFFGVVDHEAKPVFTSSGSKREYIGVVEIESESAEKIRGLSDRLGLPVIEI